MKALKGLKILDFSTLLPGPFATMTLGDLGADILKVEHPTKGDLVNLWGDKIGSTDITTTEAWLGRNKKIIKLNLKKEASIKIIKEFIINEGYDVVVEQFRPGVMNDLGLGYDDLSKICPSIIYCSLTGYGQTGDDSHKAGHDINYLSKTGILNSSGKEDSGPSLYNMQIADISGGSMPLMIGLLSALYYRSNTNEGQHVDIAMSDAALSLATMDGCNFLGGRREAERERSILNGGSIYDFYETKDGRYISVGSLEPKFYKELCKILDLKPSRKGIYDLEQKEKMKEVLLTKTYTQWMSIFKKADACIEPVATFEEATKDKHYIKRNMVVDLKLSEKESVRQIGCPIKLSKCPPTYNPMGKNQDLLKPILDKLNLEENDIF